MKQFANYLFGNLSGSDIRLTHSSNEAGGSVSIDASGNGNDRDDRECYKAYLPYTNKTDGETGEEPA